MPDRKNILFLMTDQHRWDHVGWSGRSRVPTPNLDRLAEGTVFENCLSANPICTPARTALLTGKYTHQIGTLSMSGDLSPQHPTYLQALQRAGYHTIGVGKFHWLQGWPWGSKTGHGHPLAEMRDEMKRYGLDAIWETSGKQLAQRNHCEWCEHMAARGQLDAYRDMVEARGPNKSLAIQQEFTGEPWPFDESDYVDVMTGEKALELLAARPAGKPFCAFVSFCCPHPPYDPPQRYLDMVEYEETDDFVPGDEPLPEVTRQQLHKLRRAYRAMIRLVDDQVGRILEQLEAEGVLDDTVIVFTTDHGEMMGDHGMVQKSTPYHQALRVPTAIRHPDHLDGRRVAAPTEMTDLTATMLDVAGLNAPEVLSKPWPAFHDRVPCRSLLPVIRGETDRVRDFVFSECGGWWSGITDDAHKYVRYHDTSDPARPHEALYDLAADPDELRNLAGDPAMVAVLDRARARLLHVLERTPAAQTRWAPTMGDDA